MDKNRYELIQPVGDNFRDLHISQAFSWTEGILKTPPGGLYLVSFRSIRNLSSPPAKIAKLLELDYGAFEDAKQLPGFGTYWHDDDLSSEGVGLSFCLWDSRDFAKNAAGRPAHQAAVRYAMGEGREVYVTYDVSSHYVHSQGNKITFQKV